METAGSAAPGLAVAALVEPTPVGEALALTAAIAGAVSNYGCNWDPDGPPGWTAGYEPKGCWKATKNCIWLAKEWNNANQFGPMSEFISLVNTGVEGNNGTTEWECTWKVVSGEIKTGKRFYLPGEITQYQLVTPPSGSCDCLDHKDSPAQPKPDPFTYQDEESGCTLNVQMLGWAERSPGVIEPAFEITPQLPEGRTGGGGIIGGCNFQPTIYAGGPGGPGGPTIPPIYPPEGTGDDWWEDAIKGAIQGAAAWAVRELLDALTQPKLPPASFEFIAPCNWKDPETKTEKDSKIYQWPEQNVQSRIVSNQAVIMEILQQHLNWKTPICSGHEGKGDYRTISFISVESSPYGDGRLRKRFRYRSQSGIGLDGVIDHWKDFEFDAGDVCVQHRGSSLGSPQVWAASSAEGKRVIQHAAREAGVDPNQTGEWSISGSDNPRYGVFGRMIVNTKGGYYWITSRLGENGRPLVGKT